MKTKTAAEIMSQRVVTIGKDARLTDAIRLLLRYHISGLPVVDTEQRLVGIISEHDIMNYAFSGDAGTSTVADAMSDTVTHFPPDADMIAIANCLAQNRLRRVPIVADGKVAGIVSRRDILREMLFSEYDD